MIKHAITICYDATDKIYVAEIPELQGCTSHGKTLNEACRNIEEAYESWTKAAISEGQKIPEPRAKTA